MMLLLLLHPLLVTSQSAPSAIVPPPSNVTVTCSNFRTWVSWTYRDQQPGTRFRVEIISSERAHHSETTDPRYDLTPFIWESQEHYMGFHSVNVTALQGALQSEPASSESFTFNIHRMATTRCAADFPPVHMEAKDSGNLISFKNPLLLYPELHSANKPANARFIYNISWHQVEYSATCKQTDIVCRFDLPSSAGKKQCVRLRGWLTSGNQVEKVMFRQTELICPIEATGDQMVVLLVLLTVLVLVIAVVIALVCKEKAWTLKTVPLITVTIEPDAERKLLQLPPEENFNLVDVMERRDLSISSTADCNCSSNHHVSIDSLRENVNHRDEGSSEEEQLLDRGFVRDEDSAGEEFEAAGNYDRPHTMRVDLGGGDMVDVYEGR